MEEKAWMFCQPGLDFGMVMSGVVVQNEMKIEVFRRVSIYSAQELKEFLMAVMGKHCPITLPSRVLSAANSVVVPLRL